MSLATRFHFDGFHVDAVYIKTALMKGGVDDFDNQRAAIVKIVQQRTSPGIRHTLGEQCMLLADERREANGTRLGFKLCQIFSVRQFSYKQLFA